MEVDFTGMEEWMGQYVCVIQFPDGEQTRMAATICRTESEAAYGAEMGHVVADALCKERPSRVRSVASQITAERITAGKVQL